MDAQEPTIRLARNTDAAELARMRYAFRASLGDATEDEGDFVERCSAWMCSALLGDGPWHCWVATIDGAPVGNLWLQLIDKIPNPVIELERHAYITNVFVAPEARSHGLGQRLVQSALDFCGQMGVDSVVLWPTMQSRSLYARNGFQIPDDVMQLNLDAGRSLH